MRLTITWFTLTILALAISLGLHFWLATHLGVERLEDHLALFQIVVEITIIPLGVFGFLFTIRELRRTNRKPALSLAFFSNGEHTKKYVGLGALTDLIHVLNNGNAAYRYYQITMKLPSNECVCKIRPIGDQLEHWQRLKGDAKFSSKGLLTSFPEDEVEIGNIDFQDLGDCKATKIYYGIYSDNGDPVHDFLDVEYKDVG